MKGRLLTCTCCRGRILVHELPGPFIDPNLYVCTDCLRPVDDPQGRQLALAEGREETRDYDPSMAEIPY
ncbi:MAG TPA: hypothetical protein VKB54_06965 [Solirubrobacteraceae bacterium]|nr:hypothetical protein [Solirubrobacteraceae bacterium]